MACGKPIITTNTGNIKKILKNQKTALFIEPSDSDALADAIELLSSNHTLRKKLEKNSRKRAERYSWREHVKLLEKIFYEALHYN